MPRAVPAGWVLYLAAFDALIDAQARGDSDAAQGARALMTKLHDELAATPPPAANRRRRQQLRDEASMRDLLGFLEGRDDGF